MYEVDVFTDGACTVQDKQKPGGFGVYMVCEELGVKKELVGSVINTTNNLMELEAMVQAINIVAPKLNSPVHKGNYYSFYTDSKYVMLSILNRDEYEAKGFSKVANADKLRELYYALDSIGFKISKPSAYDKTTFTSLSDGKSVSFIKVEGHVSGNSFKAVGNRRADELAVRGKEDAKRGSVGITVVSGML